MRDCKVSSIIFIIYHHPHPSADDRPTRTHDRRVGYHTKAHDKRAGCHFTKAHVAHAIDSRAGGFTKAHAKHARAIA
jgi:hypothetical protein